MDEEKEKPQSDSQSGNGETPTSDLTDLLFTEDEASLEEQNQLCSVLGSSSCLNPTVGRCTKCNLHFCLDHASEVDPKSYCSVCLTQLDIDSKVEPIIDSEGVRHNGRHIIPKGDAFHFDSVMIHDMDEAGLLKHIDKCRTALEVLVKQIDYYRISLSAAEFEAYERKLGVFKRSGTKAVLEISNLIRDRVARGLSGSELKKRLKKPPKDVNAAADQLLAAFSNLDAAKLLAALQARQQQKAKP